ncbi:hypothetical protein HK098_007914 [Nowakowskiella sp. JEL0407]|nr:hypothetical protein HK098_007914 [Nowakowskiella sp. JEL0407]
MKFSTLALLASFAPLILGQSCHQKAVAFLQPLAGSDLNEPLYFDKMWKIVDTFCASEKLKSSITIPSGSTCRDYLMSLSAKKENTINSLASNYCKGKTLSRRGCDSECMKWCKDAYCGGRSCQCTISCCAAQCFPSDALVEVQGKDGFIRMDELKVFFDKTNQKYEDVYFFGHQEHESSAIYRQISFGDDIPPLEMTAKHFLMVYDETGTESHIRAGNLVPGMRVRLFTNKTESYLTIKSIQTVSKVGYFNPYTLSGRMIVNNVQVSSHSDFVFDHLLRIAGVPESYWPSFYQLMFAPARAVYHAIGKENAKVLAPTIVNFVNDAQEYAERVIAGISAVGVGHFATQVKSHSNYEL